MSPGGEGLMASHEEPSFPVQDRIVSERGWLNFGVVGGALAFTVLSGLAVWALPFSGFSQMTVLLHTALGAAAVAAFAIWQLRHWLATRNAPRKARKLAAYIGFWLLAASAASGFLVTWQGWFGTYVSHGWSLLHLWTGVAALPFLAYHLVPEPRRDAALENDPSRRRMWKVVTGVWAAFTICAVAAGLIGGRGASPSATPGEPPRNLFAPSNAATADGRALAVPALANSASCGASGCHTAIYNEWAASAHHWSADDHFFETVRGVMTELHGTGVTEKCGACHDPVSLLSGQKDPRLGRASPGYREGDSCVVCHAVRKANDRGIGSYTLRAPKPYLFERSTAPFEQSVNRFLIRAYPGRHARDYALAPVREPESCGACHKEYDVIAAEQGPVQVETQYDDWKRGKWRTDANASKRLYCQQCHMYWLDGGPADPYDLKAGLGGKHRNHFFAAGNQYMPSALASPDAEGQIQRVTEWLRGERVAPEIANAWPRGPVLSLRIDAPERAKPGENISLTLALTNRKAGHGFPTGPLNIARAWLELSVQDRSGREIFHSGALDAGAHVEPGTYVLKPVAIDMAGHTILEPDLWHPDGPQYRSAVQPGETATFDYRFPLPRGVEGPLSIQARLRYRKANQFFMASVYPGTRRAAPITDVASARAVLRLVDEVSSGGMQ